MNNPAPQKNDILLAVKSLINKQIELQRKRKSGISLASAINEYTGSLSDPLYYQVLSERVEIDKYLKDLTDQIESLQAKCGVEFLHEFKYEGHDGHYSYHVCQICAKTDKR